MDGVEEIRNEQYRRAIAMNRFKIIMDIILVLVLVIIAIYVFVNIEYFKGLRGDVCRLCEIKTGGKCIDNFIFENLTKSSNYSGVIIQYNLSNINITNP